MALAWEQPWLAPWRDPGERLAARIAGGMAPHEALDGQGAPVRFVPQHELPEGQAYEQFIFASGCCPVRPGLHDFFNALVWMRFPRAKSALNRLQAAEIARTGISARRGPVRDAITVFDENGALLQAPPALWQALRAREWKRLFVELRPLWRDARLWIFGHALLEQLADPRKGLTAHVWIGDAALESAAQADAWLAGRCTAEALADKPFTPLPVLGVPGWWPGNENFSFYDDSFVFRPRKTPEPTTTTSAGSSRS
jgi:Protein of unknown function (DUF3025)